MKLFHCGRLYHTFDHPRHYAKITNGKKIFYVTPAHVAIYAKNNAWKISDFLSEVRHMDWKVPKAYVVPNSPENDLCWCEETEKNTNLSQRLLSDDTATPTQVEIFLRQPFDYLHWKLDRMSFQSWSY